MLLKNKKGFTLIELLVVIAIIGLLATIISASLSTAKAKGRDARRIADIKTIQTALDLYYQDNYRYPTNIYASSGSLTPNYLAVVPTDPYTSTTAAACGTSPSTAGCYSYEVYGTVNGICNTTTNPPVKYHIGAALEQAGNSALTQDVDAPTNNTGVLAGFYYCNGSGSGDFDGTNAAVAPARCLSAAGVPQGSPNATETCYDWTN